MTSLRPPASGPHARLVRAGRSVGALILSATLGLTAAACGGGDAGNDAAQLSGTEHNEVDVEFATDMLQHHAQALSMVDLTLERPLDRGVQRLAEQIREEQAPEIETFGDWLVEWDEEVPETMRDHTNAGHDMGEAMAGMDTDMPGMMSAEDMTALQDASDEEFQAMWLGMMIEHHEGAVEMARTETETGQFEPAVELADQIVASQTEQIETMQRFLG